MTKDLLVDLAIRYGFQVLGALVILGVGAILAGWLGRFTDRRLQARAMEPPLRMLAVRVLRLVVMLFAVVVALDKFGFQIAPLVAGIGVIGLGIGIALQGVLGNLVAGLSIILTKPFRVGELIQVVGVQGEVSASSYSLRRCITPTTRGSSFPTASWSERSFTTTAPCVS